MGTEVKVLADSFSPQGYRLTTLECTFPRFILAELNTHRVLSRNSASSRAIPTEKHIARCEEDPFIPSTFNLRVKGMGVGDPLEREAADVARTCWLNARTQAVTHAKALNALNVDKSRVNRLLEPFMWHTAIVSATEWSNFYALRDHPAAQPEFQELAACMGEAAAASKPARLNYNDWHLPLVSEDEKGLLGIEAQKQVSVSRCARVSYDTQHDEEPLVATMDRYHRLRESGHLSPFEHVAKPTPTDRFYGNFRGWFQHRKEIPHEDNFAEAQDE